MNADYICKFTENGIDYNSVTQYFWSKQSTDINYQISIMTCDDPSEINKMGTKYFDLISKHGDKRITDRGEYEKSKFLNEAKLWLTQGNYLKFKQNPNLIPLIKSSNDEILSAVYEQLTIEKLV